MKKRVLPLVLSFALLWTQACALAAKSRKHAAPPAQTAPAIGEVQTVVGHVQLKSGRGDKPVTVASGQKISATDTLVTDQDGRVKILMNDKNEVHVAADSKLAIEKYENSGAQKAVLLNLIKGKVRAQVHQKYNGTTETFRIKTPTTIAGVRGTDFVLAYNEASAMSEVTTVDGAVEFGQAGKDGEILNPVTVSPGQSSQATRDQAPTPPKAVPLEELQQITDEVTVVERAPEPATDEPPFKEKAEEAPVVTSLKWLRNGNIRFVRHRLRNDGQSLKDIRRVAKAQHPHSIVLTTSDSRMPPEIIFDQKLGEIFVIRTQSLDQGAIAAVEYAVTELRVKFLLVLGHSKTETQDDWEKPEAILAALKAKSSMLNDGQVTSRTAVYNLETGHVTFE